MKQIDIVKQLKKLGKDLGFTIKLDEPIDTTSLEANLYYLIDGSLSGRVVVGRRKFRNDDCRIFLDYASSFDRFGNALIKKKIPTNKEEMDELIKCIKTLVNQSQIASFNG